MIQVGGSLCPGGRPSEPQGSWLWPGPDMAIVANGGRGEPVNKSYLCVGNSAFQINKNHSKISTNVDEGKDCFISKTNHMRLFRVLKHTPGVVSECVIREG